MKLFINNNCYMLFICLAYQYPIQSRPNTRHNDVNKTKQKKTITNDLNTLIVLSLKPLTIFSSSYCRQQTPLMFSLRQCILRRPCLPHLQLDSSLWNSEILKKMTPDSLKYLMTKTKKFQSSFMLALEERQTVLFSVT